MTRINPQLIDPEHGDYRLQPGSPAMGYGCQTFLVPGSKAERDGSSRPARRDVVALSGNRINVSGPITVDTSWLADTVRVVGDVEIADQVTLSIAEGVRVEFQGHYQLDVRGCLLAIGTAGQPVLMTSNDPEAFQIDTSLDGAWNGIRFERVRATNVPSRLEYCVIEYAKSIRDSLLVGPLVLENYSGLQVINSTIRHNVGHRGAAVFCFHNASPRLTGCLIHDNHAFVGGSALYTLDSYPRLINCTIVHNHDLNPEPPTEATAVLSYMSKPQITGCILWENSTNYYLPAQLWEVKPFYTTWSDIDGGWAGEGNFDLNPRFIGSGSWPDRARTREHVYSLELGSPCINAASQDTNGLLMPRFDMAGGLRFADGRLDAGAYEGNALVSVPANPVPGFRLLSSAPNPFNPLTTISFSVDRPCEFTISVHDLAGRRIRVLAAEYAEAGKHELNWNGLDDSGHAVASGVYMVRLSDGRNIDSQKVMLVR